MNQRTLLYIATALILLTAAVVGLRLVGTSGCSGCGADAGRRCCGDSHRFDNSRRAN